MTDPTEEYGVSRPTYYQTKAHFEKAGLVGLVPRKRGPRGPHKLQGEVLAFVQQHYTCQDDRASRGWKKNSSMPKATDNSAEPSGSS